jgi:hypothetical protein
MWPTYVCAAIFRIRHGAGNSFSAREPSLPFCIVFATWFVDCFEVAPVLRILGPGQEVSVLLRLLSCMTYHPILLGDVDRPGLAAVPPGLRATLLIGQTELGISVEKALSASTRRHFYLLRGKHAIDIFGGRALHSDSFFGDVGLAVFLNPTHRRLPSLSRADEHAIASSFQSSFLAYRMRHYAQVQEFEFEADAVCWGSEDELRTWLAAISGIRELTESVLIAFGERREELSQVRYEDPKCLVAEAALMFCHREGAENFFVRELAEKVNDLLVGRHADFQLKDRKVGSVLRHLGVRAERVTKGYRVKLDQPTGRRIHDLAAAYEVLSVGKEARCAECKTRVNERMKV